MYSVTDMCLALVYLAVFIAVSFFNFSNTYSAIFYQYDDFTNKVTLHKVKSRIFCFTKIDINSAISRKKQQITIIWKVLFCLIKTLFSFLEPVIFMSFSIL